MKVSRILVGACVLAMAVSAAFAAGASASLPELGRCVLVPRGTGEYIGKNCNHPSPTHKGEYNFIAGAVKNKFEGSGENIALETPKLKISCAGSTVNGEYTGAKTSKVALDLIGCLNTASGHKCSTNPAKEGEIEGPQALNGELGFITGGEKPTVGLDLVPESSQNGVIATFACGEQGIGKFETELAGTIEGSVIGKITKVGVMVPEFTLNFKGTGGKQVPEKFESGPADTLTLKVIKGTETTTEGAVLKEKALLPNEESLEIKAVP